ncbi:MAG: dUTP diphosphatase [Candidatus Kaiserbacteria bacterium]|nr:dUTP diphosphatase [Candidatus Kaiserbacteria bacterium]MCB9816383.1 dUTP diphosphatase [Candidatus Nomurabacteria bacterium]
MEILIKRLTEQAKLPAYARSASPGIDLFSQFEVPVEPGAKVAVSTGVAVAIPVGYIGWIKDPKSMAIGHTVTVTAALVDSSYRDEIVLEVTNHSPETKVFAPGDVVARLLIQKVERANIIEAEDLSHA